MAEENFTNTELKALVSLLDDDDTEEPGSSAVEVWVESLSDLAT